VNKLTKNIEALKLVSIARPHFEGLENTYLAQELDNSTPSFVYAPIQLRQLGALDNFLEW